MVFSKLCQLNGGCMGCCGHDFSSKKKIEKAIKSNSLEFIRQNPHTNSDLISFRDRYGSTNLKNGVCRNLIEQNKQIFCPLHPKLNNQDLREGHCNINYLCETTKKFASWDEKKQNNFIKFIKSKKLEKIDYSLQMDQGQLLAQFKEKLK
jgi:hypothetical protein